jgi:hypothetical protein
MKYALAIVIVLAATTAHAQTALMPHNSKWLPPPEYDRPYEGKLTIVRVNRYDMPYICPKTLFPVTLACAWRLKDGAECQVIIATDDVLAAAGWTYEQVWRHERGQAFNATSAFRFGARSSGICRSRSCSRAANHS